MHYFSTAGDSALSFKMARKGPRMKSKKKIRYNAQSSAQGCLAHRAFASSDRDGEPGRAVSSCARSEGLRQWWLVPGPSSDRCAWGDRCALELCKGVGFLTGQIRIHHINYFQDPKPIVLIELIYNLISFKEQVRMIKIN